MTARLLVLAVEAVPALLWGIIAFEFWRLRLRHRARSTLLLLLPIGTTLFAAHMLVHVVARILEPGSAMRGLETEGPVAAVTTLLMIPMAAILLHAIPLLALRPERLSGRNLACLYGSAALVAALYLSAAATGAQGWSWAAANLSANGYVLAVFLLALLQARHVVRSGTWLQGIGVAELRSPDLAVFTLALACAAVMLGALWVFGDATRFAAAALFLHTMVALAIAVPFAVRMLGRVVRSFLLWSVLLSAATALFFGAPALRARIAVPELARALDLAAFALLLAVLVPGSSWLLSVIDRLLFHRGRERHAELQRVASALSPAAGVEVCCRQAIAELVRVMQFSGAAILLSRGRRAFAVGDLDLPRLSASWPANGAAAELPPRPLMELEILELPEELRVALAESRVARLAPIASPRQRWGHLFAAEPLLAPPFSEADVDALAAFLAQLALVLDASELVERAVEVERSLAHAEKLAAIGELAARVAHEIRNPVTAARSLAQLVIRDPASALNAEHAGLILTELDRVERQVADLLRFARREDLRLETVDLASLVRRTIADLRPELESLGISVSIDAEAALVLPLDGEKIRQVLINLVENARDAIAEGGGNRRLEIVLRRAGATARLRVSDSGPGIPREVLPRLFEPFFSLKPHGTGLGLAIVKRTIEAHGGRIHVACPEGGGACFGIDLPLPRDP